MRILGLLLAGTTAVSLSMAASAQVKPLAEDARAFGARETVTDVAISPSGNKVMLLMAGPGRSSVAKVFDLNTGNSTNGIITRGDPESIYWCEFATDDRLVCKYGGNLDVEGVLAGFSRTATVLTDGTQLKMLGQSKSFYDDGLRQNDGYILDWLPEDGGSVLMAREYIPEAGRTGSKISRTRNGLGVDKINLVTLKTDMVEAPNRAATGYMTDGRGNVRVQEFDLVDSNNLLTGVTKYKYRKAGSKDWEDLGTHDPNDPANSIYPLAIEAETDSLFLLKKLNGRQALYQMKLDGSRAMTLVAKHDKVDISGVSRFGRGQRVIAYSYTDEATHSNYFDKEFDSLATRLGKALPKAPAISFNAASRDGQKLVVYAASDVDPGTYYYLDRKTSEMSELAKVRPALAGRALATVKPVTFASRDGATIPAYVTMPPGSSGKNLPAVVLPHGGPSARDKWGFDWLAQFLAARGYVVIQPNYRGSAGYGDEFENGNGYRNWQTSISDIIDSAEYLVKAGIADKNRLAIVGWSYGGYAALQSAAIAPSEFKAVVAVAPVTDLALRKRDAQDYTSANLVSDQIGSGSHITAGSPLRHAASIKVPVLLVHGDKDINVSFEHSVRMASALTAAGAKVEFLQYKGLDHQLDDSNARTEMLTKMGELLDRTIGH